jgi:hypothetical protein
LRLRCGDGAAWPPLETEPVKMLSKKLNGPPLDGCAPASPDNSKAAAIMAAAVLMLARCFIRPVMSHPALPKDIPLQEASSRFPTA